MRCFAELISCNGTSEHHHPHRHFSLRLESFSRDTWKMQGRPWQRHFSLQHNLFQMEQPDYLCSITPCSFLLLLEMLAGKKIQVPCHLHEHFDTVCKCILCLRCSSWDGLKSCLNSYGNNLQRVLRFMTVCHSWSITKQISETDTIKGSSCNQVIHIHSLLKGLCWLQNSCSNFSDSQPPHI